MHPFFSETMMRSIERELAGATKTAYQRQQLPAARRLDKEPVLLRLTTVGDAGAMQRLAALECLPNPDTRCVVAEVDGTVVAALPLHGGKMIADPFRPTAHLIPLLELRAKQLAGPAPRRRNGLRRLVRVLERA